MDFNNGIYDLNKEELAIMKKCTKLLEIEKKDDN